MHVAAHGKAIQQAAAKRLAAQTAKKKRLRDKPSRSLFVRFLLSKRQSLGFFRCRFLFCRRTAFLTLCPNRGNSFSNLQSYTIPCGAM
jgi:hypothetical protein